MRTPGSGRPPEPILIPRKPAKPKPDPKPKPKPKPKGK
jgi:hypothetical protein